MNDKELIDAIEKKYITPTKNTAKKLIGIEFEFPIVNLDARKSIFTNNP